MKTKLNLKTVAFATIITAGLAAYSSNEAVAGHPCVWKTVTVYVPVTKEYTYFVTRYDHCGKPYRVAKTTYKTIQVPVQKRVQVCY